MKFKLKCKNIGDPDEKSWWEEYDKPTSDPHQWAKEIVQYFNDTLRPKEKPRELLEVIVDSEENDNHHKWNKLTSEMTVYDNREKTYFDGYKCSVCGLYARKYGLNGDIQLYPPSKFKATYWQNCRKAKEKLSKRK